MSEQLPKMISESLCNDVLVYIIGSTEYNLHKKQDDNLAHLKPKEFFPIK